MLDFVVKRPALSVFLLLGVVWFAFGKDQPVICNDGSRLATIESLVARHTQEITDSMFVDTCDKVKIDGKFYSDKPAPMAIVGAAVYAPLKAVGLDFRTHLEAVYRLLTLMLVVFPAGLIFFFTERLTRGWAGPEWARPVLVALPVFGTLALPYTATINNHVPAAAFLLGSFALLRDPAAGPVISLAFSGLLLGLATSYELMAGLFAPAFALLALWRYRDKPVGLGAFALLSALPVAATLYLYYSASGSIKPFIMRPDAYLYPGSVQKAEYLVGGGAGFDLYELLKYIWHGTIGYKGVLSHSALLMLAYPAMRKRWRDRAERPWVLAVVAPVIGMWLVFMRDTIYSYGGSNFGFRYMILWMPLVSLYAIETLRDLNYARWALVVAAVSVLTGGMGLRSPWQIHKWVHTDLDTFDFLSTLIPETNPYEQLRARWEPAAARINELRRQADDQSRYQLAFAYFQAMQPARALGTLQLLGETGDLTREPARDWACFAAVLFSDRVLKQPDLMQHYQRRCSDDSWARVSQQMGLGPSPSR